MCQSKELGRENQETSLAVESEKTATPLHDSVR